MSNMSFMRFLNLTIADDIPDSKTIWNFREQLIDLQIIEPLFHRFSEELARLGLLVHEGKIVDASFVEVPKQRNSKEENDQIKDGKFPESFTTNPYKLAQKDTDARWTQKNGVNFYGYKNHIKADRKNKFIVTYHVTDASIHDSQALENLLDGNDSNQNLYADSAYTGQAQEETIKEMKMSGQICEKGYRNKSLTVTQKENNRKRHQREAQPRKEQRGQMLEACFHHHKIAAPDRHDRNREPHMRKRQGGATHQGRALA
jgi:IS5 family transposase